ncbi:MAG: transglutaminase domain-containing protein [Planctomycetota bacterium]|nr:MAG: transglutaminase domain-containing protein [Planctomycetota bacterium]
MRKVAILILLLQLLLCLPSSADEKKVKSLTPVKAKDYVYLSTGKHNSALVQDGNKIKADGLETGRLCFHKEVAWSGLRYLDKKSNKLTTPEISGGTKLRADATCSDGKLLWVLDARRKKLLGLTVTGKDGRLRLSHDPSKTLDLPCAKPIAVTYAGNLFYVIDADKKKLFAITIDGKDKSICNLPSETSVDIAYGGGYFWLVDEKRKAVYALDEHGVIILYLPLPFAPAGVAHDQKTLLVSTLADEKALYRFALNKDQKYTLGGWMEADIAFSVKGRGDCHVALPENSNRQKIQKRIRFSPAAEIAKDNWEQKAAKFSGNGEIKARARMYAIHYNILPETTGEFPDIPGKVLKAYTVDGEMLKLTSKPVSDAKKKVEKLIKKWDKKRTPYWVARCAYEYLVQKVHYERIPGWVDAPTLLTRGTGTCSPISFAYVALCRSLGMPARFSAGTRNRGGDKDPTVDREFHRWCEIYLPNFGWVPVDPSATGKNPSALTAARFWGFVPADILVMTRGGGGSDIFGWAYNGTGGIPEAVWSNKKRARE